MNTESRGVRACGAPAAPARHGQRRRSLSRPRLVAALVATTLVTTGSALWQQVAGGSALEVVVPGKVYRSGALPPAELPAVLAAHGIRTVVDFRISGPCEATNPVHAKDVQLEAAAIAGIRGVRHVNTPRARFPVPASFSVFAPFSTTPPPIRSGSTAIADPGVDAVYIEKRQENMRYGEYRRQGLHIGSGLVEAACCTDVARRCKQSGMHWRLKNAAAMCALVARFRSNLPAA